MERLVVLCCLLLSIVSVSSGTLCLSNMECPSDQLWCVQNCSAVAIEEYNLTALYGNCKISSTVDGSDRDDIYGCYIGSCSTDSPGLYTASSTVAEDTDEVTYCCTGDLCNTNFTDAPTASTNDYNHIYPFFPSHTTPGIIVILAAFITWQHVHV